MLPGWPRALRAEYMRALLKKVRAPYHHLDAEHREACGMFSKYLHSIIAALAAQAIDRPSEERMQYHTTMLT
jgi:hypothetical protein